MFNINHNIVITCFFLLTLFVPCTPIYAQTVDSWLALNIGDSVLLEKEELLVYDIPPYSFTHPRIIASLPKNSRVKVLLNHNSWSKIKWGENYNSTCNIGWVPSIKLQLSSTYYSDKSAEALFQKTDVLTFRKTFFEQYKDESEKGLYEYAIEILTQGLQSIFETSTNSTYDIKDLCATYTERALAFWKIGDIKHALNDLSEVLYYDKNYPNIHFFKGLILEECEFYSSALNELFIEKKQLKKMGKTDELILIDSYIQRINKKIEQ